ncbi:MAG: hypothetical protein IJJ21_04915 [Firmicutes bacterium]|nr:hypothetical protein [Bacillota bacterium]
MSVSCKDRLGKSLQLFIIDSFSGSFDCFSGRREILIVLVGFKKLFFIDRIDLFDDLVSAGMDVQKNLLQFIRMFRCIGGNIGEAVIAGVDAEVIADDKCQ